MIFQAKLANENNEAESIFDDLGIEDMEKWSEPIGISLPAPNDWELDERPLRTPSHRDSDQTGTVIIIDL